MSLVTNANQLSSNFGIRLEKLQNLYQVLKKNEPNQRISKVFTNLEKIDRHAICTMSSCETIGRKHIVNKIAMRNAVERHMGALKKAEQVFQTGVVKNQTKSQGALPNSSKQQSKNPLVKLPQDVLAENVLPFLTEKERGDLRSSCRDTRKIQTPASSIIKTYHLENLIETYLHVSSSNLTRSGKAKTLNKLMSLAHSLSEIEKLPRPTYLSLTIFFQEVEARNLIRMMEAIHKVRRMLAVTQNIRPLPNLPAEIEDLRIPKDSTAAIQKANRLRNWIDQYQGAIAAIDGILKLGNKDLSLLPKEIGQLKALEGLYLEGNRLVSLPKEIGQLKALQGLHLENNRLVGVPKVIGQLRALQWLHLQNNRLVSVPKEIGQLKALQALRLYNNRLVSVPKAIGQLKALQVLRLDNNRLVSVPKAIGQLRALQWLYSQNNRLVSVPKEIGQLQALNELHLDSNHLVSVPKEIGQLKALNELRLDNNRLVSLPKEIGQLKALERLHLQNNGLISLPQELDRFKGALEKQNK